LLHILVAHAFLGPRPAGLWINHKNGDKGDNRACNLEYTTPRDNLIHAIVTGLRPALKLTPETVREIRQLRGVLRSGLVAQRYGITRTHVKGIWNRKCWTHLD
jgi:hypothetical protein